MSHLYLHIAGRAFAEVLIGVVDADARGNA